MTAEDYQRQVLEHAGKLGYVRCPVTVPASGWTDGLVEYLLFRHPASGCHAIIRAAPLDDRYISRAKGQLQAELNRALGIKPKPRKGRPSSTSAYQDMLDDPASATEPPDRFWSLALLRLAEAQKSWQLTGPVVDDGPEPSAAFQARLDGLRSGLACVNCGDAVTSASSIIYCGEFCQQMAGTVRYVRKAAGGGRFGEDEFLVGLGQRLVALLKGGYPARARFLNPAQREAVFERDGRICQLCGNPAEQVDHISGNSSNLSNLRAACRSCNRLLAMTAPREPTRQEHAELLERAGNVCSDLAVRVAALAPSRCCDDHERWQAAEPGIRSARRKRMQEMEEAAETDFEDVDGYLWDSMQKED